MIWQKEGFQLFKTAFDFFYDMDSFVTGALKLKHTVEEGLLLYKNIYTEMKKQESQKLPGIHAQLH